MYKPTQDVWLKKRGLREMDASVLNYFQNVLDVRTSTQDNNTQTVPVFFATAERRYTSDNPNFLDKDGTLRKPYIRIRRTGIDRTKGFYGSAAEDSSIRIATQISGKTNNLQNLSRSRLGHIKPGNVIYEVITVPFPDYFVATYELEIETVYIKTMNEILETIWQNLDFINSFKIPDEGTNHTKKDNKDSKGFFYVGFLDTDVRDESNLEDYTDQEREIKQILSFRVGGMVISATDNMPNAQAKEEGVFRMTKQYTAYKIKFGSEESMVDEEA